MDSVERNDLDWIRRLARRLAANADDADDVVQDTWLAVRMARPDRTRPLRPWLAEVVRNLARSRFRVGPRRRRRERAFHELQAPEVPPPDVAHARDQVHRIVAERAQALDEPLRTIVRLRFFEDRSSTEIAAELGVPAGTVRWRLKTAMDQLRSDLDGRFEGDRRAWAVLVAPAVGAGAGKGPRTLSPLLGASLGGGTLALVAGLIALSRLSTPTPRPSAAIAVEPAAARPAAAGLQRPAAGPALEPASGLAEVEGVVLDPEGGPVAGAAVLAIRQSDDEELPENLSEHVPAGHSDGNGSFHLPRLAPGRYAITATGRGFTPGWTELMLRPGQRQVGVRLTVAGKGVELTGRLTDPAGGPIAGGSVSAHSVIDELRSGPRSSVSSDREGRYRLELPAGEYAVQAVASGYAGQGREVPLFVPTRHDFHLHPGARIAGRVEGPPGPGKVGVRALGRPGLPGGQGEVKPDGSGRFLLDSLSPGVYVIEARRGAAVGRSGAIAVGAGGSRTDVTIHLQPMPLLRGHLRTQDGRPIARAFVTAGVELAHTDDQGAFTLEGVWPGKVSLRANALGFASEVRVLALVEGVTPPAIELVLQPDSQVRGQVLDPAGAPASFARLTLITRSGEPGRDGARLHTLTDRRGRFSVDGLAGILEVRADHAAGLGSAGPVQLVPGSPASVEVRLRPGAFVSGVVRREDGTPALGAHVRGRLRGSQTWVAPEPPPAETAADGSFRIGPFDAGEVAIRASVPDVPGFFTTDPRPDSQWLHLAAGEERTGVVLVLDPAEGQIAGQVVQEDGQPLAGALVSGLPEQDGIAAVSESARAVSVLSGADGRFALSRLRRGRYTLRVSHPELPAAEQRHVPPGTTDLTLRMAKGATPTGVVEGTAVTER